MKYLTFKEFMEKQEETPEDQLILTAVAMLSTTPLYSDMTCEQIYNVVVYRAHQQFNSGELKRRREPLTT